MIVIEKSIVQLIKLTVKVLFLFYQHKNKTKKAVREPVGLFKAIARSGRSVSTTFIRKRNRKGLTNTANNMY